jgi:glycosyltransferase involved in cell wall biosynthesis
MPMRIAVTADPYIPVPPRLYGGIERIVHFLVRGLVSRHHEVTLFAHPASHIEGVPLVSYGAPPHSGVRRIQELWQLGSQLLLRRRAFDVVHSFGRLASLLPILTDRSLPKLQSYQRVVPWTGVRRAVRLGRGSIQFTGCSAAMFRDRASDPSVGSWHTIFNGVEIERYTFSPVVDADAPLVYLGRVEFMKGVHVAIEIARRSNRRLVIAGNARSSAVDREYFDREIAPAIDGERVTFIGPVDDQQKNALLGAAAALVFPTFYPEAFGIVMAESMACGTPVIGYANGAVPEVVRDGVTGFLCRDAAEGAAAVARLSTIDRAVVRRDCEQRFSADVIVSQYEALYRAIASS